MNEATFWSLSISHADAITDGGRSYEQYLEEEYFSRLEELKTNTSKYNLVQGDLYEDIVNDARIERDEALDITTHLNNGEVDKARQRIGDLLEDE